MLFLLLYYYPDTLIIFFFTLFIDKIFFENQKRHINNQTIEKTVIIDEYLRLLL